jgi:hypothetical protein
MSVSWILDEHAFDFRGFDERFGGQRGTRTPDILLVRQAL